jgi:hypothetical protein
MKMLLLCLGSILLVASLAAPQETGLWIDRAANPAEAALVGEAPFVGEHVIVRLPDEMDLDVARGLLDPDRFEIEEPLMPTLGMYLVHIRDGTRVPDAILALAESAPMLRYAVPDHVVTPRSTTPNDPSYGSQWCHAKMQSALAWDYGQGSEDFVVSVVDGGCLLTHGDLSSQIYDNPAEVGGTPGVDDDGNGYVDDLHGWNAYSNNGSIPNDSHGTHVNGIVGARGNNGTGVAGVNWRVTLMPVAGSSGTTSIVVKAYNYVRAQKQKWLDTGGALGANVVSSNSSFGVDFANCNSPSYAPWNDAYNAMGAVGILSCAATMNINANVDVSGDVPTGCSSPWLVTVTNTTSSDTKNSGAAYGATTIDLGAPGTSIYSTYSNGGYTNMTGTSMATPQVAGAIAFLHSVASSDFAALRLADPADAALVLKQIILDNVDVLPSLNGVTVSGGRLNLYKSAQDIAIWTDNTVCQTDLGFGGPGSAVLSLCGDPLGSGGTADLLLTGAPASTTAWLTASAAFNPVPFKGGALVTVPILMMVPFPTNGAGTLAINNLAGGHGPLDVYVQFVIVDPAQPAGYGLSNALLVELLP